MFFDFLDFMEIYIVSPDFHWQKSSSTVGRNLFRKNMLGYLDVAIAKNLQNLHAILCCRFVTEVI